MSVSLRRNKKKKEKELIKQFEMFALRIETLADHEHSPIRVLHSYRGDADRKRTGLQIGGWRVGISNKKLEVIHRNGEHSGACHRGRQRFEEKG